MKIATWNVNSVKARLEAAVLWVKEAQPDVVCLQEIKTTDDSFPAEAFESLGYNCAVHGQKTYNGVAILSKRPMEDVTPRLPGGDGDDHARYIEAVVPGEHGVMRIASVYAPNGNPIGTDKFKYKLAWMERLARRAKELLQLEEPVAKEVAAWALAHGLLVNPVRPDAIRVAPPLLVRDDEIDTALRVLDQAITASRPGTGGSR